MAATSRKPTKATTSKKSPKQATPITPKKTAAKKTTAKKTTAKKTTAKKTTAKKTTAKKTTAKKTTAKKTAAKKTTAKKTPAKGGASKPKLLSGGNPQIPKGDGDAPVQAYLAAMPGWKQDLGRRLDALIVRTVPDVLKAVKWNSPFYGVEGRGWFVSFHCLTNYIKVAFFRGTSLKPLPPGESKDAETRYLDIYETDDFDEERFANWIHQASELPGWVP